MIGKFNFLFLMLTQVLLIMTLLTMLAWRLRVTKENKKHWEDIDQLSMYLIGSLLLPFLFFVLVYIKLICWINISISRQLASILVDYCLLTVFFFHTKEKCI